MNRSHAAGLRKAAAFVLACFLAAASLSPLHAAVSATSQPTHMYWFDVLPSFTDFALKRSTLSGEHVTTLMTLPDLPTDLAVDSLRHKLYWVSGDAIFRANLNGSGMEVVPINPSNLIDPHSIALDSEQEKIYWTDKGDKMIRRANFDGTQIEDIIATDRFPEELQLDSVHGKLYWIDLDTTVNPPHGIWGVRRANSDGTGRISLSVDHNGASNLALDPARNAMFWSTYATGQIERSTLSGMAAQIVHDNGSTIRGPWEMAVDPATGDLYWGELISGAIRRSSPFGGPIQTLYLGNSIRSFALGIPEPTTTALLLRIAAPAPTFMRRRNRARLSSGARA